MKDPVEVGKLHEIMQHIEASLGNSKTPRWFRGSGKYPVYRLEPTLLRHKEVVAATKDPLKLEQQLKARFLQTSAPFLSITQQLILIGCFCSSTTVYQHVYWIGLKIHSLHCILLCQAALRKMMRVYGCWIQLSGINLH